MWARSHDCYFACTQCLRHFALALRGTAAQSWARSHDCYFAYKQCLRHFAPALRGTAAQSWARSHNQRFSETSFQNLFYAHFAYTQKGHVRGRALKFTKRFPVQLELGQSYGDRYNIRLK